MRTKILWVILLAGCGSLTGGGSKATVTAKWSIKKADGTPDVCPANYGSVKLVAQAFNKSLDIPTGDPFTKVFDCNAGQGTIELQVSGDEQGVCKDGTCAHDPAENLSGKYVVSAMITEASGTTDVAPSFSHTLDLTKGDASADFTLYPNAGFRLYNWGFEAMTDGRNIGCAEAGVDQVKVTTRQVMDDGSPDPGGFSATDTFPCDNDPEEVTSFGTVGAGQSSPMPLGYYATEIQALSHGEVVGTCSDCSDPYLVQPNSVRWLGDGTAVYWHEGFFVVVTDR